MRYLILTYWQVYGAMAVGALCAYWAGWGSAYVCYRPALRSRGVHARRARPARPAREQLPEQLPELPPVATAVLEARHANAMAATAPRNVLPFRRAATAAEALSRTIGMTAITAYVLDTWARKDRPGARPWSESTGTFPAVMAELEESTR